MDGWITIGTQIDESKFDKQIAKLEKQIEAEEKNTQLKLDVKIQAENELKRHKQAVYEIEQEYEKTSKEVERLNNLMSKQSQGVKLTPTQSMDLMNYDTIISENEKIGASLDKAYTKQIKLNNNVSKTSLEYQKSSNKVKELKSKIDSINLTRQQEQAKKLQRNFNGIEKSVTNSIASVAKLALGVLSIASAYSLVSSASSTLGQYDKEYASNLEYIRYLLAQALAPALRYLVNLASTLLSYLNYILKARFNITLFSKNSAKNFENAKRSTSGISKDTRKIKQDLQTTSFDEMTVLNDTTSSTSGGGGGADFTAPSIDPSLIQGEVPKWLKWIAENKDLIIAAFAGIAGGIAAIKIIDLLKSSEKFVKVFKDINGVSKIFIGLGIGLIIGGIVLLIKDIIDFIKDPTWENFANILRDIGIILAGLAITMLAINASNPFGWVALAIAAILLLASTVIKHWDEIKEVLGQIGDWVYEHVISPVVEFFKGLWEEIQEIFSPFIEFFESLFSTLINNIKISIDNIKQIVSFLWEKIKEILSPVADFFKDTFEKAYQKVKSVFEPIVNFFSGLWDKVKNKLSEFGAKVGEVIGKAFKDVINGVIGAAENVLNKPINAINKLIDYINDKVPLVNLTRLETFDLPRMKVGGIINMPGRGIPIGGGQAVGGEAGQEGILPLTDTQAMETLGEAIGRYITINANITNAMNGRVISRQMQQIKNDDSFAYNT